MNISPLAMLGRNTRKKKKKKKKMWSLEQGEGRHRSLTKHYMITFRIKRYLTLIFIREQH